MRGGHEAGGDEPGAGDEGYHRYRSWYSHARETDAAPDEFRGTEEAGDGHQASYASPVSSSPGPPPRLRPSASEDEQVLVSILGSQAWFMAALRLVRELRLPDWVIGAGAIRSVVWDHLHGHPTPTALADLDVAYFDPTDLSRARDQELEARLRQRMPEIPWEVTNQAGVHLWFERVFGYSVEPLTSIDDAIATWPETATCVAVRLLPPGDRLRVYAPYGLDDLLGLMLRRNPRRISRELFERRLHEKRILKRWPRVTVIREEDRV
jgi:hypothetical protein